MRRLIRAPLVAAGILCCAQVWAQSPPQIVLDFDRLCADVETEARLASELRLRVPEVIVTLGASDVPDAWRIVWATDAEGLCQLDVVSPSGESSRIEFENPSDSREYELVASQIAWVVTMTPVRVEPAPVEPNPEPEPEPEPQAETQENTKVAHAEQEPNEPELAAALGPEPDFIRVPFVVSFVPGRHLPHANSANLVPSFHLGMIGGRNYGLEGFEASMAMNHERSFMHGVQLAFGFNRVQGEVSGVQVALGANFALGPSKGISMAFGYNQARSRFQGVQVAVGVNQAMHDFAGAQVAIGLNMGERTHGAQVAVIANTVDRVRGVQAASVNVAGLVQGVQVGGLNFANRVEGAQVGLVNISRDSDVPIGLINIMLDQPVFVAVWGGWASPTFVGIQHGGSKFRYMYGASFDLGADVAPSSDIAADVSNAAMLGMGVGFGYHSSGLEPGLFVDTDVILQQVWRGDFAKQSFLATLRAVMGWQFGTRWAVYVGPTLNYMRTSEADAYGLPPSFISALSSDVAGQPDVWIWPGVHVGVRF